MAIYDSYFAHHMTFTVVCLPNISLLDCHSANASPGRNN